MLVPEVERMDRSTQEALASLVLGLGVFTVLWWAATVATSSGLAQVSVAAREVIIRPRGLLRLMSLRRDVRIAINGVVDAVADPHPRDHYRPGVRTFGTALPGPLLAASCTGPDGRSFWLCGSGRKSVVLTLSGAEYDFIVVEVDDPQAVIEVIRSASGR